MWRREYRLISVDFGWLLVAAFGSGVMASGVAAVVWWVWWLVRS